MTVTLTREELDLVLTALAQRARTLAELGSYDDGALAESKRCRALQARLRDEQVRQ